MKGRDDRAAHSASVGGEVMAGESLELTEHQDKLFARLIEHVSYARQCLDPLRPLEIEQALQKAERLLDELLHDPLEELLV